MGEYKKNIDLVANQMRFLGVNETEIKQLLSFYKQ